MSSPLHIKTPLISSSRLTKIFGRGPVYLKLENLQPSGSFKIRGMGATCQAAKAAGARVLVGSSGGNAGMAMAVAAKAIGLPIVLFIPTSTPTFMVEKIKAEDADVRVTGSNWNEANDEAIKFSQTEAAAFFVHPFDQETCWDGHSTIVTEIQDQLITEFDDFRRPSAVVSCVGGGGLAIGILLGLEKVNWTDAPVILMETVGADCFSQALKAGHLVDLPGITSVAKSLGALTVAKKLFDLATGTETNFKILSRVVEDKLAIKSCVQFANDQRLLVEPACGAALSAIYCHDQLHLDLDANGPIIVIVCGGNLVSIDLLEQWKNQFEL